MLRERHWSGVAALQKLMNKRKIIANMVKEAKMKRPWPTSNMLENEFILKGKRRTRKLYHTTYAKEWTPVNQDQS